MIVDRNALWQAWPEGYLPMNGVTTIGGWVTSVDIEDGPCWHSLDTWFNPQERVREMGQLLPAVDPAETATWACLLLDLARATMKARGANGEKQIYSVDWRPTRSWPTHAHAVDDPGRPGWLLTVYSEPPNAFSDYAYEGTFNIDTEDPALALVLARIRTRGQS